MSMTALIATRKATACNKDLTEYKNETSLQQQNKKLQNTALTKITLCRH
jgi:hypothetical protein